MTTINAQYLQRAEALREVAGATITLNPAKHSDEMTGGIRNPRRVEIAAGTKILRFGIAPDASRVASGNWWLDWENYAQVERMADRKGGGIAAMARLMCGVPTDWGGELGMTMLVQASVKQPLSAFRGEGAVAESVNVYGVISRIDPGLYSDGLFEQLYIPGLSNPDLRKAAIHIVGARFVTPGESRDGYTPELSW